jgi:hypothetical protein
MEKITKAWAKFNKEIPDMNCLSNIIRVNEPRTMNWVGYVLRIGGKQKCRRSTGRET